MNRVELSRDDMHVVDMPKVDIHSLDVRRGEIFNGCNDSGPTGESSMGGGLRRNGLVTSMLLCLVAVSGGCTHEAVYNDLQRNQRLKCAETTSTQVEYEKCIEPTEQTFRDYVREREETMGDESSTD